MNVSGVNAALVFRLNERVCRRYCFATYTRPPLHIYFHIVCYVLISVRPYCTYSILFRYIYTFVANIPVNIFLTVDAVGI